MAGKHEETDGSIITPVVLLHRECDVGIFIWDFVFVNWKMQFVEE